MPQGTIERELIPKQFKIRRFIVEGCYFFPIINTEDSLSSNVAEVHEITSGNLVKIGEILRLFKSSLESQREGGIEELNANLIDEKLEEIKRAP